MSTGLTYSRSYSQWVDGKKGNTPITASALNNIEDHLERVYDSVLNPDKQTIVTKDELETVETNITNLNNNIQNLQTNIDQQFDETQTSFNASIQSLQSNITTIDQQLSETQTSLNASVEAVEQKIPLVTLYTLEPNTTIDEITTTYTDSFGVDYFNYTPNIGDIFHCIGLTQVDKVAFSLTGEITGLVDLGNGKQNATFKTLEVVSLTTSKSANSDVYEEDFKVTEQFGKYSRGATVPAAGKTTQEVIQDAFCSDSNPTIIQPSANLTINCSKDQVELGDKVDITYSLTTSPGNYNYGPTPTGVTFSNPTIVVDGNTKDGYTYTDSNYVISDITTTFGATAAVNHTAGVNAYTHLGNDSGQKINAGTCTATASKPVSIVYPIYSGTIDKSANITEAIITALNKTVSSTKPSKETYTTNNTCPVIAYPSSFGNITSIIDNNNFTQKWTKSSVTITIGKNGATKDITYNVYVGSASTAKDITYRFN